MKYVKLSVSPEGELAPVLRTQYDFADKDVAQPADIVLAGVPVPAIFGTALFGNCYFSRY